MVITFTPDRYSIKLKFSTKAFSWTLMNDSSYCVTNSLLYFSKVFVVLMVDGSWNKSEAAKTGTWLTLTASDGNIDSLLCKSERASFGIFRTQTWPSAHLAGYTTAKTAIIEQRQCCIHLSWFPEDAFPPPWLVYSGFEFLRFSKGNINVAHSYLKPLLHIRVTIYRQESTPMFLGTMRGPQYGGLWGEALSAYSVLH